MELNDAQRQKVAEWVAAGMKLSEIQTRMGSELGLKMTYMEVRFLVDDLKLTLKDPDPPKPVVPPPAPEPKAAPAPTPAPAAPATPPPADALPDEPAPLGGKVSVVVDQVTRPGALVSGKVTFSDGQNAEWYLDQYGRLGLAPKQQGYKPTSVDVHQFQLALEAEMQKLGY